MPPQKTQPSTSAGFFLVSIIIFLQKHERKTVDIFDKVRAITLERGGEYCRATERLGDALWVFVIYNKTQHAFRKDGNGMTNAC